MIYRNSPKYSTEIEIIGYKQVACVATGIPLVKLNNKAETARIIERVAVIASDLKRDLMDFGYDTSARLR